MVLIDMFKLNVHNINVPGNDRRIARNGKFLTLSPVLFHFVLKRYLNKPPGENNIVNEILTEKTTILILIGFVIIDTLIQLVKQ